MKSKYIKKPLLVAVSSLLFTGLTFAFNQTSSSNETAYINQHEAGYTYGQCTATTQKGTRCKRGVSNEGDTKCYQHK